MVESRSEKDGRRRNIGLVNQVTFEVLEHALSSKSRYLSMGELAEEIHHHYEEADKKSAEYKQIKKLLPREKRTSSRFLFKTPGFFHVKEEDDVLQQSIQRVENSYREALDKYSQAVYDYELGTISSDDLKVKEDRKNGALKEYRQVIQRYQIYAPNFRGLLLYLYLCKIPSLKKDSIENQGRKGPGKKKRYDDSENSTPGKRKYNQTISKIRNIINKPSVQERAPFLKYWHVFDECGFNVIELLLQIAEELYHQLDIDAENDKYLLRRASERYFIQVENYCHEILDNGFYDGYLSSSKITVDKINTLVHVRHMYRKHMVPIQTEWIQTQLETINCINDSSKEYDIARDTSFDKDKIILLSDLALKYDTDIAKVSKALGLNYNNDPSKPDYYPYNSRKYLVTNTCLIPEHEIDKLKPLLSSCMNFLDACSLFEKHGIPESCHQEIIPKLGFEIIRMLGDQWNDTKKWFIVERPLSNIEIFFRTYLK
jgi:hypothetical protein